MSAWLHVLRYPAVAVIGLAAGMTGATWWYVSLGALVVAGMLHSVADLGRRR